MSESAPVQTPRRSARKITGIIMLLEGLFVCGLVLSGIFWGSTFFFHWPRSNPPQLTIPALALNVVALVTLAVFGPVIFGILRDDGQPRYKKWRLLASTVLATGTSFATLFYSDPLIRAAILFVGGWLLLIPLLVLTLFSYWSFKHTEKASAAE